MRGNDSNTEEGWWPGNLDVRSEPLSGRIISLTNRGGTGPPREVKVGRRAPWSALY